jgi:hypothetical protein
MISDEDVVENVQNPLSNSLKIDNDLFRDEDAIVHKIISVRRVAKGNSESWNIFVDKKNVLKLPGERFSMKERTFFRTVDGINFIIKGYKEGWNSVNKFKQMVKVK